MMRESEINQKPITKFEGSGKIVIVSYPKLAKKHQKSIDSAYLMDQIKKNMTNGEYKEALEKLDQVIDINPDYARAYFLKGLIYKIQHDYDTALNFFDMSLQKDYNNDETWYEKGILLSNDYYKKYDDAIECFNNAMEFNSKHEEALNEKRRTIEKKEIDSTIPQKNTNYDQNPIINIIDIRCSNDKNGKVNIIFNVSGIRHESKDTNYTVYVTDWDGNLLHHHNGKIVKEAPNPAQECITYTLPLRKGSYNITFKMNNIVVNKEFETLDC
jgi:tetratricopeptide (TPR) repeat protein